MNSRVLDIAFALMLFLAAYWSFYLYDPIQMGLSTVLFLSGLHSAFRSSESEARRKFGRSCLRLAAVLSVFLIIKIWFF
jgi:hypothetical protein